MTAFLFGSVAAWFDTSFCLRLTQALAHFLWQGCVIAALFFVVSTTLRRRSANARYAAGVAALLLMAACLPATLVMLPSSTPLPTETTAASLPLNSPPATIAADSVTNIAVEPPAGPVTLPASPPSVPSTSEIPARKFAWSEINLRFQTVLDAVAPYAAAIYLAGVALMMLRVSLGLWGGRRLRQSCVPIGNAAILRTVRELASRLGLRMVPAIAYCHRTATPIVVGVLKPTILLPIALAAGLTPSQLEAMLAHELAHVRRYDLAVNVLQRLIEAILFFHPAVWWISRRVSQERENACDDLALRCQGQPLEYADALVRIAELCAVNNPQSLGSAALAATGETPSHFKRRILRLLGHDESPRLRISRMGFLLCALAVISALLMPAVVHTKTQPAENATAVEADNSDDKNADNPTAVKTDENQNPATISGRIVLEDGSPAKVKGTLYYELHPKSTPNNSYCGIEKECTDHFSKQARPGKVLLTYLVPGFAPAFVGPLDVEAGEKIEEDIVLNPGFSATIRVVSGEGQPIGDATVSAQPVLGTSWFGERPTARASSEPGQYKFEHLAKVPYKLRVEADGYEILRTDKVEFVPDEPINLEMKRSLPTTGVVLNADGTPSKGAKFRLICENISPQRSEGGSDRTVAVADEKGRFTLNQLSATSFYGFLIEAADKSCMRITDICAGQENVEIQLPPRRDLHVRIRGDLSKLPRRNGKWLVDVSQSVLFDLTRSKFDHLIHHEMSITRNGDEGFAEYLGLIDGAVKVTVGGQTQTVDVADEGVTEVVFELGESKEEAKEQRNAETTANPKDGGNNSEPYEYFGRVTDAEGKPMGGVEVKVFSGYGTLREVAKAITDDSGSYRVRFPPGMGMPLAFKDWLLPATAYAMKRGYYEANTWRAGDLYIAGRKPLRQNPWKVKPESMVYPREPRQVDFVLKQAAIIEGRLTDAQGKPVSNYDLWLTCEPLPPGYGIWASAKTDAEGRFVFDTAPTGRKLTFGLGSGHEFDELLTQPIQFDRPGKKNLELVWADGQLKVKGEKSESPENKTETKKNDPPSPPPQRERQGGRGRQPRENVPKIKLSGKVIDSDGIPVAGTEVSALFQLNPPGGRRVPASSVSAKTSLIGTFELERPAVPAALAVRTEDNKFGCVVRIDEQQEAVTLQLAPLAIARGQFVDEAGTPVPDARFVCTIMVKTSDRSSTGLLTNEATTDEDGRYTLPGLVPGETFEIIVPRMGRDPSKPQFQILEAITALAEIDYKNSMEANLKSPGSFSDDDIKRKKAYWDRANEALTHIGAPDQLPLRFEINPQKAETIDLAPTIVPRNIALPLQLLSESPFAELELKIAKGLQSEQWNKLSKAQARAVWDDFKKAHTKPDAIEKTSAVSGKQPDVKSYDDYVGRYWRSDARAGAAHLRVARDSNGRFFVRLEGHLIPAAAKNQTIVFTTGDVVASKTPNAGEKQHCELEIFKLIRVDGRYYLAAGDSPFEKWTELSKKESASPETPQPPPIEPPPIPIEP